VTIVKGVVSLTSFSTCALANRLIAVSFFLIIYDEMDNFLDSYQIANLNQDQIN